MGDEDGEDDSDSEGGDVDVALDDGTPATLKRRRKANGAGALPH